MMFPSLRQRNILYNRAAKIIAIHDVKEADDLELSLRWAKKHTDSDPPEAYLILNEEEPNGEDVLKAAISGIKSEREYDKLSLDKINKAHLKKLLLKAPFDVRVEIAGHFKDEKALRNLSKEALKEKNLDEAYNLWVKGKGNPKDSDISKVRTKLITGKVSGSKPCFLNFREDTVGAAEYYDALMNAGDFEEAHEVALNLGDGERTQRTREKMLKGDLEKTLSFFADFGGEVKDRKGIEQVAEKVAETYDVPTELVRDIIAKHHRYIRK